MDTPEAIANILDVMADKIRDGRYQIKTVALAASDVTPADCTLTITYTDMKRRRGGPRPDQWQEAE